MNSSTKKPVLSDHKAHRKRLIPPLLVALGDRYSPYSWARELVPELFWIALLHQGMGLRSGVSFGIKLGLEASRSSKIEPVPFFCKMTSFYKLDDQARQEVFRVMSASPDFASAQNALRPMFTLFPESPLTFLSGQLQSNDRTSAVAAISKVLPPLYDRHSRESVLMVATAAAIGFRQDKIRIAAKIAEKLKNDFAVIEQYPETDESKQAAAMIRAMAPMFLMEAEGASADSWREYFWEQVAGFGPCVLDPDADFIEAEPLDDLGRITVRFRNTARAELRERLTTWGFDLNQIEQHEVIGALLARQVTLATDLASAPFIWTPHSAPLFLRAMADVVISLAWIMADPQERSKKFVDDGLGAIKLEIEHRKRELEAADDDDPRLPAMIEYLQSWLESQRFGYLVEVNLGAWSGRSTRQMAEEAGILDFYNYVYQPFSATVHSTWPHLSDKNLLYCGNPAHRFHRLPISVDLEPDGHWLLLAGKYLQMAFSRFDEFAGIAAGGVSAYRQLKEDFGAAYKPTPESESDVD